MIHAGDDVDDDEDDDARTPNRELQYPFALPCQASIKISQMNR